LGGVAASIEIFVAPDGDDSNTGTADHPLRTAAAARDLVRKDRATGGVSPEAAPATVRFRAGVYHFGTVGTLELGPADSYVVYEPDAADQEVVFTGERALL